MSKIQSANAASQNVTVNFVRTGLSDAGLKQLGQYKHLRHVNAFGSRITAQGIEALKKDIPEVDVQK